jgi:CHAT domain-containing protein
MRKLLDFDLVVEALDDGYRTRVIASPAGEAQASLVLPFNDKDLRILVLEVAGSIGRLRRKVRRIETQDRQLIENFGGQLYQALVTGPVGDCLERSRVTASTRDAGLRIRLRLPGALANVPWEYLYDAQHGFLGLDPDTALVRYLELPEPVRPFPIRPPLRVLAMISAPSDLVQLDVEQEWARLNQALMPLASQGLVEVDRLEDGTLAALPRALRLREYHVLHFIGHGGYDEEAQDGALALEDAVGKTRLVTGRDLSMMIRHRSLRLVVLNACEGSRIAPDDPFSGVAQALARQGIPAVIAMQFEISDPAALAFSQSFYQAMADGLPVDVATVEARRAMFADDNEIEWATPVLYLRSTDGRVFTRRRSPPTAPADSDESDQQNADRLAREEADRQNADRLAREEAHQQNADQLAREEAHQQNADQLAREEADRRDADQVAREEADRRAREEAHRRAREEAHRQNADRLAREEAHRRDADRLAREEAHRRDADRRAREEAHRRHADRLATEGPGREETRALGGEQVATGSRLRVPVLAFGPLILSLPLMILAVKVLVPSYPFTKSLALAVLCIAILGGVVAAVEHQRLRIPVWTTALEFFFAWFLIYAIYKLNVGHIHRIVAYVPPLAILAGIGAVVSAVLCHQAIARSPRKGGGVHPLLPAFLICMVIGLGAAAIGYASTHYSAVQILQRIGPSCYHIGGVFLFAALLADLLAPLLALVRKLNGR